MVSTSRANVSCGAVQLHDLEGIGEGWLRTHLKSEYSMWVSRKMEPMQLGFARETDGFIYAGETVIFSDRVRRQHAIRLAGLIKKHKLGKVVGIRGVNPNTKNIIVTYLWRYNGKQVGAAK